MVRAQLIDQCLRAVAFGNFATGRESIFISFWLFFRDIFDDLRSVLRHKRREEMHDTQQVQQQQQEQREIEAGLTYFVLGVITSLLFVIARSQPRMVSHHHHNAPAVTRTFSTGTTRIVASLADRKHRLQTQSQL